jgi:hypothetical protein
VLRDQKNFSTASEDHNQVCVWVFLSQKSDIFFNSKDLVETFCGEEFIKKNDLSAVLNHAMTGET